MELFIYDCMNIRHAAIVKTISEIVAMEEIFISLFRIIN